jgi:hypothetical protein
MFCGHPGRSSVPTYYEMRVVGEERIYAEGAAKLVWINPGPASRFRCPTPMRADCSDREENHEQAPEKPIWKPRRARCRQPSQGLRQGGGTALESPSRRRRLCDLHAWSIDHPEEFWASVWEFGERDRRHGRHGRCRCRERCPAPGGFPRPG